MALKTTEQFIKEAKAVHGDKYLYDKTIYRGAKTKTNIECAVHGVFYQTPTNHLSGRGCRFCAGNVLKDSEDFVNDANKVHKGVYDYSLVEYKGSHENVKIICTEHGVFQQSPTNHLRGKGCNLCGYLSSGMAHKTNPCGWNRRSWEDAARRSKYFDSFKVYIIECYNDEERFYKIGRTFTSVDHRFRSTKLPYNYKIISQIICNNAKEAVGKEAELKNINRKFKYAPKKHFHGYQECYDLIVNG